MAVVFRSNEISLEDVGTPTTIPNNDVARLMFYLNCVCYAIDCNHDPDIQRFASYNNWSYLSIDEQKQLLGVCHTFSPDVFDNRVFFHSDVLCRGSFNKFYQINQVRHEIFVAESIVIAGRLRQVNKIMTYTIQWMRTYYLDPLVRLAQTLSASSQRSAISYTSNTYRSTYTPTVIRQPSKDTSSRKCTSGRVCVVVCCILFTGCTKSFATFSIF